jgi:hypothetical protein
MAGFTRQWARGGDALWKRQLDEAQAERVHPVDPWVSPEHGMSQWLQQSEVTHKQ